MHRLKSQQSAHVDSSDLNETFRLFSNRPISPKPVLAVSGMKFLWDLTVMVFDQLGTHFRLFDITSKMRSLKRHFYSQ